MEEVSSILRPLVRLSSALIGPTCVVKQHPEVAKRIEGDVRLGGQGHCCTDRNIKHPSWDFESIPFVLFVDLTPEERTMWPTDVAVQGHITAMEWVPPIVYSAHHSFLGSVDTLCTTLNGITRVSTTN
jgi:hypothetical protein